MKIIKSISLLLILSFLLEHVSFASDEIKPLALDFFAKPKVSLTFPDSVARVEDSFMSSPKSFIGDQQGADSRLRGNDKVSLVYLIADAHTNPGGQENLSKVIGTLLEQDKRLKYIFSEAGVGNNSLSFLRKEASLYKREQIAKKYLKQGLLHGEEYLDLTSDKAFTLWGVENPSLYMRSLEAYKKVAKNREKFQDYLNKIQIAITTLKPRLYNPSLLELDQLHEKFLKEEISLTDYIEKLNRGSEFYPHLQALKELKTLESKINFNKANEEQIKAILSLSKENQQALLELKLSHNKRSPFKLSSQDHKEEQAFYALLGEKIGRTPAPTYPNLFLYFQYLKQAQTLNPQAILKEQKELETQLFLSLASTSDEQTLLKCQTQLRLLKKLFDLKLTPEEYQEYKDDGSWIVDGKSKNPPSAFTIRHLTGFLNKKIMDLHQFYERVSFLEQGFDPIVRESERFYELTTQRDRNFIENMLIKMDDVKSQSAVLITGGFHTTNLKSLLKARGISYISITPQVFQETNQKRYERILFSQKIGQAEGGWRKVKGNPVIASPANTLMPTKVLGRMLLIPETRQPVFDILNNEIREAKGSDGVWVNPTGSISLPAATAPSNEGARLAAPKDKVKSWLQAVGSVAFLLGAGFAAQSASFFERWSSEAEKVRLQIAQNSKGGAVSDSEREALEAVQTGQSGAYVLVMKGLLLREIQNSPSLSGDIWAEHNHTLDSSPVELIDQMIHQKLKAKKNQKEALSIFEMQLLFGGLYVGVRKGAAGDSTGIANFQQLEKALDRLIHVVRDEKKRAKLVSELLTGDHAALMEYASAAIAEQVILPSVHGETAGSLQNRRRHQQAVTAKQLRQLMERKGLTDQQRFLLWTELVAKIQEMAAANAKEGPSAYGHKEFRVAVAKDTLTRFLNERIAYIVGRNRDRRDQELDQLNREVKAKSPNQKTGIIKASTTNQPERGVLTIFGKVGLNLLQQIAVLSAMIAWVSGPHTITNWDIFKMRCVDFLARLINTVKPGSVRIADGLISFGDDETADDSSAARLALNELTTSLTLLQHDFAQAMLDNSDMWKSREESVFDNVSQYLENAESLFQEVKDGGQDRNVVFVQILKGIQVIIALPQMSVGENPRRAVLSEKLTKLWFEMGEQQEEGRIQSIQQAIDRAPGLSENLAGTMKSAHFVLKDGRLELERLGPEAYQPYSQPVWAPYLDRETLRGLLSKLPVNLDGARDILMPFREGKFVLPDVKNLVPANVTDPLERLNKYVALENNARKSPQSLFKIADDLKILRPANLEELQIFMRDFLMAMRYMKWFENWRSKREQILREKREWFEEIRTELGLTEIPVEDLAARVLSLNIPFEIVEQSAKGQMVSRETFSRRGEELIDQGRLRNIPLAGGGAARWRSSVNELVELGLVSKKDIRQTDNRQLGTEWFPGQNGITLVFDNLGHLRSQNKKAPITLLLSPFTWQETMQEAYSLMAEKGPRVDFVGAICQNSAYGIVVRDGKLTPEKKSGKVLGHGNVRGWVSGTIQGLLSGVLYDVYHSGDNPFTQISIPQFRDVVGRMSEGTMVHAAFGNWRNIGQYGGGFTNQSGVDNVVDAAIANLPNERGYVADRDITLFSTFTHVVNNAALVYALSLAEDKIDGKPLVTWGEVQKISAGDETALNEFQERLRKLTPEQEAKLTENFVNLLPSEYVMKEEQGVKFVQWEQMAGMLHGALAKAVKARQEKEGVVWDKPLTMAYADMSLFEFNLLHGPGDLKSSQVGQYVPAFAEVKSDLDRLSVLGQVRRVLRILQERGIFSPSAKFSLTASRLAANPNVSKRSVVNALKAAELKALLRGKKFQSIAPVRLNLSNDRQRKRQFRNAAPQVRRRPDGGRLAALAYSNPRIQNFLNAISRGRDDEQAIRGLVTGLKLSEERARAYVNRYAAENGENLWFVIGRDAPQVLAVFLTVGLGVGLPLGAAFIGLSSVAAYFFGVEVIVAVVGAVVGIPLHDSYVMKKAKGKTTQSYFKEVLKPAVLSVLGASLLFLGANILTSKKITKETKTDPPVITLPVITPPAPVSPKDSSAALLSLSIHSPQAAQPAPKAALDEKIKDLQEKLAELVKNGENAVNKPLDVSAKDAARDIKAQVAKYLVMKQVGITDEKGLVASFGSGVDRKIITVTTPDGRSFKGEAGQNEFKEVTAPSKPDGATAPSNDGARLAVQEIDVPFKNRKLVVYKYSGPATSFQELLSQVLEAENATRLRQGLPAIEGTNFQLTNYKRAGRTKPEPQGFMIDLVQNKKQVKNGDELTLLFDAGKDKSREPDGFIYELDRQGMHVSFSGQPALAPFRRALFLLPGAKSKEAIVSQIEKFLGDNPEIFQNIRMDVHVHRELNNGGDYRSFDRTDGHFVQDQEISQWLRTALEPAAAKDLFTVLLIKLNTDEADVQIHINPVRYDLGSPKTTMSFFVMGEKIEIAVGHIMDSDQKKPLSRFLSKTIDVLGYVGASPLLLIEWLTRNIIWPSAKFTLFRWFSRQEVFEGNAGQMILRWDHSHREYVLIFPQLHQNRGLNVSNDGVVVISNRLNTASLIFEQAKKLEPWSADFEAWFEKTNSLAERMLGISAARLSDGSTRMDEGIDESAERVQLLNATVAGQLRLDIETEFKKTHNRHILAVILPPGAFFGASFFFAPPVSSFIHSPQGILWLIAFAAMAVFLGFEIHERRLYKRQMQTLINGSARLGEEPSQAILREVYDRARSVFEYASRQEWVDAAMADLARREMGLAYGRITAVPARRNDREGGRLSNKMSKDKVNLIFVDADNFLYRGMWDIGQRIYGEIYWRVKNSISLKDSSRTPETSDLAEGAAFFLKDTHLPEAAHIHALLNELRAQGYTPADSENDYRNYFEQRFEALATSEYVKIMEGTTPFLEAIAVKRQEGYTVRLYVVSLALKFTVEKSLTLLGIRDRFDGVFGSDWQDTGTITKADTIVRIAGKVEKEKRFVVMGGDSASSDVKAAGEATRRGVETLAFATPTGQFTADELAVSGAVLVIPDLAHTEEIFNTFLAGASIQPSGIDPSVVRAIQQKIAQAPEKENDILADYLIKRFKPEGSETVRKIILGYLLGNLARDKALSGFAYAGIEPDLNKSLAARVLSTADRLKELIKPAARLSFRTPSLLISAQASLPETFIPIPSRVTDRKTILRDNQEALRLFTLEEARIQEDQELEKVLPIAFSLDVFQFRVLRDKINNIVRLVEVGHEKEPLIEIANAAEALSEYRQAAETQESAHPLMTLSALMTLERLSNLRANMAVSDTPSDTQPIGLVHSIDKFKSFEPAYFRAQAQKIIAGILKVHQMKPYRQNSFFLKGFDTLQPAQKEYLEFLVQQANQAMHTNPVTHEDFIQLKAPQDSFEGLILEFDTDANLKTIPKSDDPRVIRVPYQGLEPDADLDFYGLMVLWSALAQGFARHTYSDKDSNKPSIHYGEVGREDFDESVVSCFGSRTVGHTANVFEIIQLAQASAQDPEAFQRLVDKLSYYLPIAKAPIREVLNAARLSAAETGLSV